MQRLARLTGALIGALLCAGLVLPLAAQVKPDTRDVETEPIDVNARPLAGFDKSDPARQRFGRLAWRGGLELSSPADSFGGWSGIALDAEGRGFVAVSDAGVWMTGQLAYEGAKPKGIANAKLGPLQAIGAKVLKRNRDRDAEAVALVDGTPAQGNLLIAFEQNQRIGRFEINASGVSAPRGYIEMPPELKHKRKGDGVEAMTVMKGGPWKGAVIAIAEHFRTAAGHHTGWLWVKGVPQRFNIEDQGGFDVTDAVSLADGSLIVLERRFRWFEGVKMRLRQFAPADLQPGALLAGDTLYEAGMGHEIDNMEALGVHRGPRGETVLTLMSDDNFNGFLQRTILLQFELLPNGQAAAR
jgi:hypothetical protein